MEKTPSPVVATPTEKLATLREEHVRAVKKYENEVLALCPELSPLEAFEARLGISGMSSLTREDQQDEEDEGVFKYEAVGSYFLEDTGLPGEEDPRYKWVLEEDPQDHDCCIHTIYVTVKM
jgi:hypothetical protein